MTLPETAAGWGFPSLGETCPPLEGSASAWLPGMRVDRFDWHLIIYNSGDVRRYLEAGGAPEKAILHFLSWDAGIIDPWWGKGTFFERVDRIRGWGISKLVSIDFSAWAHMPLVAQAYNYYKSAVVNSDLVKAGFSVIPNVQWSRPSLHGMVFSFWGHRDFVLIDCNHNISTPENVRLFWAGAERMLDTLAPRTLWLWGGPKASLEGMVRRARARNIPNVLIVPSRAKALSALCRVRKERAKCLSLKAG
jgi:hypothetical protein